MIRELGVLDQDLGEHHGVFGMPARDDQQGVAYPMTFVLDERGRVERKIAEANYRVRDGGRRFFAQLTGGTPTPGDNDGGISASVTKAEGPVVLSRARLDSPTYFAYQRLGLHLDLAIAAGWHAYGPTVPDGYQPLRVTAESTPPGARVGPIEWPPTRPFRVALPAYGSALVVDAQGNRVGVESEAGLPQAGARLEVFADPTGVAGLVRELGHDTPPHFSGFVWFRMPLSGDRRAHHPGRAGTDHGDVETVAHGSRRSRQ